MLTSKHSLVKSFGFAFDGLKTAITQGRNFRIQIFIGACAITLGFILKLSYSEWLHLILIITIILILELINTSIEAIVDIVSPEVQKEAKIAKDVAAATVLLASIGSIIIGAMLFLPKILTILNLAH